MWISLSCAASLTSSLVAALSDNELSAELKDLSHGTAGKPVICSRLTECAEQVRTLIVACTAGKHALVSGIGACDWSIVHFLFNNTPPRCLLSARAGLLIVTPEMINFYHLLDRFLSLNIRLSPLARPCSRPFTFISLHISHCSSSIYIIMQFVLLLVYCLM